MQLKVKLGFSISLKVNNWGWPQRMKIDLIIFKIMKSLFSRYLIVQLNNHFNFIIFIICLRLKEIHGRILKANLSWSPTWTKFCLLIASLRGSTPSLIWQNSNLSTSSLALSIKKKDINTNKSILYHSSINKQKSLCMHYTLFDFNSSLLSEYGCQSIKYHLNHINESVKTAQAIDWCRLIIQYNLCTSVQT